MSDSGSGSKAKTKTPDASSEPLYGATPPPYPSGESSQPTAAPPQQPLGQGESATSAPPPHTTEPLSGATPPPEQRSFDDDTRDRVESGSREGVRSLIASRAGSVPARSPLTTPPTHARSSPQASVPTFLRRLAFLISIFLGASSVIAGAWSFLFLPLLHASYSARKALVDQQSSRIDNILQILRVVRKNRIYTPLSTEGAVEGSSQPEDLAERSEDTDCIRREASVKEIHSQPSAASSISQEDPNDHSHPDGSDDDSALPHIPLDSLKTLSTSLKELSTSLESTATTRTSLISTLESYTSHLHRQLFVSKSHSSFGSSGGGLSVGLGTLSANLSQASGFSNGLAGQDASGIASRGEEWDAVRKEVRAIKGLLLNRRSLGVVNGNP